MRGTFGVRLDVDREDLAVPNQLAHRCQEKRAAAERGPALDNQLWAQFLQDLLVDPKVQWALQCAHSQPVGIAPCARVMVEKSVELVDNGPVHTTIGEPVEVVVVETFEALDDQCLQGDSLG